MNKSLLRNRVLLSMFCILAASTLAPAQVVIVDDADSGFSVLSGDWTYTNATPGHWGNSYQFVLTTAIGEPASSCEFRPDIPVSGVYEVAVWYTQGSNRATDAPYTVYYDGGSTTVDINQETNGSEWVSLGSFPFQAGTSGRVVLSNNATASVVIADAVQFTGDISEVELNMASHPPSWGTTAPEFGGPYTYDVGEVVSIEAFPGENYGFSHWEVTAGSEVANPTSPSTTVTMDASKSVIAHFYDLTYDGSEFRAMWVNAFNDSFKSASDIEDMITRAKVGNFNAILPEVMAYQDTGGNGHGAYWDSDILPIASDINPAGFDPLAYMVERCHAEGIEVHCWLVAFRVSSSWPPTGNSIVTDDYLMVPQASAGSVAKVGNYYTLDPGNALTQDYLISIVKELCANYDIDGIHWDYIRYTQRNAGYPADLSTPKSSLKRFKEIHNYSGTPPYDGNSDWNDFRRRGISELVRRCRFEVPQYDDGDRKIRFTSALVTWYPASVDFHQTRPYYDCYSDWEDWAKMGYLDATIPMAYFDEDGAYSTTYRQWVDNCVSWKYGRHTYIGPGIYMNSFDDSVVQIEYADGAGADGYCTYSYRGTNNDGNTWYDWYPYIAANYATQPVDVPTMDWRDPTTATDGVLFGKVIDASTGNPIDNVSLTLSVPQGTDYTDGNGWYVFARCPAVEEGSEIQVTASKSGYPSRTRTLTVIPGITNQLDIPLGPLDPGDWDGDGDLTLNDFAWFGNCMTGPDAGPVDPGCEVFDMDSDDDVDLADFGAFQVGFDG